MNADSTYNPDAPTASHVGDRGADLRRSKSERRLKILYIITKGSPYGGAQKYVYELSNGIPVEHFEVAVLIGEGEELPAKLEEKNIRVIRLRDLARNINIGKEFKVFWQLLQIIRAEKPDVVHLNSSKIGGLGALAARLARVPNIIFTAHGWAFNEKRSYASIQTIRFLSWITILLCHRVIVIAKNERVQATVMPFAKNKIIHIYNGIEPIDFKAKTEARQFFTEKIGEVSSGTVWIGTIAELHTNKNLSVSIAAVRELSQKINKKIIFVVVGTGEEMDDLEREIRRMNLTEKVFLVGHIENASLYLKAFDIFILPSLKEGLPYTLLEAGLAGLPCLSTYVGGIPEITRNNISGVLVDPPSIEKISAGLQLIIENPDKAKEFAHNLKEKVKKDFSIETMITETIKVYGK